LFGKYAIDEVKEFYDKDGRILSELQTGNFKILVDTKGYDPQTLFKAVTEVKELDKKVGEIVKPGEKPLTKKQKIVKVLEKYYNGTKIDDVLIEYYRYKAGR